MSRLNPQKSPTASSKQAPAGKVDKDHFYSSRLITEYLTLENELRKVRYLSPFAEAPTVAHQVTGVMLIGNALSEIMMKKDKSFNKSLVLEMLLWHDAPETRYGDIARDQRKYLAIDEEKARTHIFGSFPWGEEIIDLIEKFEDGGEQYEFKIAKDADALYVVYTIKSFLDKGVVINNPDDRIGKTLKRLMTEEGIALGKEMGARTSEEIAQLLWKYSMNGAGTNKLTKSLPDQALATKMVIAWCLCQLMGEKSKEARAQLIEDLLHYGIDTGADSKLVEDVNTLYEVLVSKRDNLRKPDKRFGEKLEKLLSKIKTKEAQNLGAALKETDLYDWWNIMMEYANVGSDGRIVFV